MTTTSRSNRAALGDALEIYLDAMRPFITRCLRQVRGDNVETIIRNSLLDRQAVQFGDTLRQNGGDIEGAIDFSYIPILLQRNWRDGFSRVCNEDRTLLNESGLIAEARNQWAHIGVGDLEREFVRSRLFDIASALKRINAPRPGADVETIRDRLLAAADGAPAAAQTADAKAKASAVQPERARRARAASLAPWREVIRPNQDVQQGRFKQAEFAADLQHVHDGRASATEYGNPVSFFNRTYITPGIHALLVNALRRLAGHGGDPVIQTKTGFGGGKTHSLIALHHLATSADTLLNASASNPTSARTAGEIRQIVSEAGLNPDDSLPAAAIAVLVGTYLSPTDTDCTPSGAPLNTLWGQMAWQLGGQDAYTIIEGAARQGTAPGGGQLDALFERVGPCVILMDEIVAYVRNAGHMQDSIYTFIQSLTEAARRSQNAVLVVTLPESDIEAGGVGGQEALARLDSLFGRIEAVWQPLEVHEAFEVVRRRLFGDVIDTAERDRTCEAFSRMYGQNRRDYPRGVNEQNYLERMKACYPIHPEIFDRLYTDWSAITRFQRTRGVLRMMANCVSRLYLNQDPSPLILPGTAPLGDPDVGGEFARLLSGNWEPVLSEVDRAHSKPDEIDQRSTRYAAVGGAARRMARAIFLGSAGSGAVRGIDIQSICLGVVEPGHGVSVYNEALALMTGELYYLYSADKRYYFHVEQNLNRVAADRAAELNQSQLDDHIIEALRDARGRRRDTLVCPDSCADVPDSDSVQLVVLKPSQSLPSISSDLDEATRNAHDIVIQWGEGRLRNCRNMLLFLAAQKDDIRVLRGDVRQFLAWDSIVNGERRIANLKGDRFKQARNSLNAAEAATRSGLVRAYHWVMAPVQDDPQRAEYRISSWKTNNEESGEIIQRAFDKFIQEEILLDEMPPSALVDMLERHVWGNNNDHISIDALWDMMTSNVYMERLRDKTVLMAGIAAGVRESSFGYAESHDQGEYKGIRFGEALVGVSAGAAERVSGLLVNPVMAALVVDEMKPQAERAEDRISTGGIESDPDPDSPLVVAAPPARGPQRIIARKMVQNDFSLDDISQLSNEIIHNLRADGGEITITIAISAHKADGFSEGIARSVRENSAQLGLDVEERA